MGYKAGYEHQDNISLNVWYDVSSTERGALIWICSFAQDSKFCLNWAGGQFLVQSCSGFTCWQSSPLWMSLIGAGCYSTVYFSCRSAVHSQHALGSFRLSRQHWGLFVRLTQSEASTFLIAGANQYEKCLCLNRLVTSIAVLYASGLMYVHRS